MICFKRKSREVVQNNTMFPLVSRFFHCQWRLFILHFTGALTVPIHSFYKYTLLRKYLQNKLFLASLWNEMNGWSSEHCKIERKVVAVFCVIFPFAVAWRTSSCCLCHQWAQVGTGDEGVDVDGTTVVTHHGMHAGGRVSNLVFYQEKWD